MTKIRSQYVPKTGKLPEVKQRHVIPRITRFHHLADSGITHPDIASQRIKTKCFACPARLLSRQCFISREYFDEYRVFRWQLEILKWVSEAFFKLIG